jgi:hypothetical protein
MVGAGFDWSRVTVAQAETDGSSRDPNQRSRRVTVEELIGLTQVLETTVLELLGPGPITNGSSTLSSDDLVAYLVGGPQEFTPEERTLLTRRALVSFELMSLSQNAESLTDEMERLDDEIDELRTKKENR